MESLNHQSKLSAVFVKGGGEQLEHFHCRSVKILRELHDQRFGNEEVLLSWSDSEAPEPAALLSEGEQMSNQDNITNLFIFDG